jgi:hypothetical protein
MGLRAAEWGICNFHACMGRVLFCMHAHLSLFSGHCSKLVAEMLGAKSIVVPSVASTDAPCTALSVLYHPDGTFDEYVFFSKSPDIVRTDEGEGREKKGRETGAPRCRARESVHLMTAWAAYPSITSHHITSHHITSHHITSHDITSHHR